MRQAHIRRGPGRRDDGGLGDGRRRRGRERGGLLWHVPGLVRPVVLVVCVYLSVVAHISLSRTLDGTTGKTARNPRLSSLATTTHKATAAPLPRALRRASLLLRQMEEGADALLVRLVWIPLALLGCRRAVAVSPVLYAAVCPQSSALDVLHAARSLARSRVLARLTSRG